MTRSVVVGAGRRLRTETVDVDAIVEALGGDLTTWSHDCHSASIRLVRSGLWPVCRVARGSARGVMSQHSWVVVSADAYDMDALLIDPTLWSYRDDVDGVWIGSYRDGLHMPHGGFESIWEVGRPPSTADRDETPIELDPPEPWSDDARRFLNLLGPLGQNGWSVLVNQLPPHGWPAGEVIAAMMNTPAVSALVPIDIAGMVTDANPHGLYLPPAGLPPATIYGWRCIECGTEDHGPHVKADDDDLCCPTCDEDGRDPWCIDRFVVTACPTPDASCAHEDHHHGNGRHETPVES